MMSTTITVVYAVLAIALVLAFIRLIIGPSTPDRVVALELTASLVVGTIGVHAIDAQTAGYIDVAVVMALTGFLAAIGFARYVERGASAND